MMKGKNKFIYDIFICVSGVLCILIPVYVFFIKQSGWLHWQIKQENYQALLLELMIWLGIAIIGLAFRNAIWLIVELLVFSYAHIMLFPMVAAVAYAGFTFLVGEFVLRLILSEPVQGRTWIAYFMGICILTILYAVASLLKVGSIRNLIAGDAVLCIFLCVYFWRREGVPKFRMSRLRMTRETYGKLVILMLFLMLAIGRANLSIDYDSAWYGLRSFFTLDHTTGIYDNLKLTGCVYTYSKGMETYLLPLSSSVSYGFVYAANIIFGVLSALLAYAICAQFVERKTAVWGGVLFTAIPGIMNMTITAKTDVMTLFVQMLCIYFSILMLRKRDGIYWALIWGSYIVSQTLKPTAVVFSTSLLIAVVFVKLVYRVKIKRSRTNWVFVLCPILELVLIWGRTWYLTGMPAGSLWGKIFRLIGMKEKYPYASGQIVQYNFDMIQSKEGLQEIASRLWQFFFSPNSEVMDHVVIAWGTTLCTWILLCIAFVSIIRCGTVWDEVRRSGADCYIALLIVGETLGCIASLMILNKPDGNYFVLYYTVTVMGGVIFFGRQGMQRLVHRGAGCGMLFCFVTLNIMLTGGITWNWTCSFTKIDWINRGYYNHEQKFEEEVREDGYYNIYKSITKDSATRVLAYGIHPDIERIPCIVESELDVSYWGNTALMDTQEHFLEYMEYASYDYILITKGYIQPDTQAYNNILALLDTEKVESLINEKGYLLLELGDGEERKCKEYKSTFVSVVAEQAQGK